MELKLNIKHTQNINIKLLIVPYGIETVGDVVFKDSSHAFNRTLWN